MPVHSEDYGKDVVTLHGDDVFFLDTNAVIAYLYKEADYHEATLLFIRYLLYKQVVLCISEVVVMETLNSLARELYISDGVTQSGAADAKKYRGKWSGHIIKREPSTLRFYHEKARELILPFLDSCIIAEANEEQVRQALDISIDTPLGSADALVVSSAVDAGATGLISLDKDMEKVNEVLVYRTEMKNDDFDGDEMIGQLGSEFEDFLRETMGEEEFRKKYQD